MCNAKTDIGQGRAGQVRAGRVGLGRGEAGRGRAEQGGAGQGRATARAEQGRATSVQAEQSEMGKSGPGKASQIDIPSKSCLQVVSNHGPLRLQASIMSSLQDAVSDVLLARNAPVQMLMPQELHEGPLHTRASAHMHIRVKIQHSLQSLVALHLPQGACAYCR